jgi:ribonuclease HI
VSGRASGVNTEKGGGADGGKDCAGALRRLAQALAADGLPPRPEDLGLSARELAGCLERAALALEAQDRAQAAGGAQGSNPQQAAGAQQAAPARQAGNVRQAAPAQNDLPLSHPAPAGDPSFHILHADGGSRGNPGPAGAGAALLDCAGQEVALLKRYLGVTTNNVAEYQGLILGLEAALARGIERLEVRLDSELLVRQLQGRYKVKAPHLLPLYQEAKSLLARFASARLTHIPRAQNALADALANQAMDSPVPGLP